MRYLSDVEAAAYLDMARMTLVTRRDRGQPPAWIKTMGEVRYSVDELEAFARQREGARIALHFAELERTAKGILASEAAEPLVPPELEATACDLSHLLHEAGDRELAAKLYVAGSTAAERLAKYNPGMSPEQARSIATQMVARTGYLIARNRRLWTKLERYLATDPEAPDRDG
jgi:hypothetical protein